MNFICKWKLQNLFCQETEIISGCVLLVKVKGEVNVNIVPESFTFELWIRK